MSSFDWQLNWLHIHVLVERRRSICSKIVGAVRDVRSTHSTPTTRRLTHDEAYDCDRENHDYIVIYIGKSIGIVVVVALTLSSSEPATAHVAPRCTRLVSNDCTVLQCSNVTLTHQ